MLLEFPKRTKRRHARASTAAGSSLLAASATIIPAVMPAAWARSVANTASHHSSGIRLRCDHFATIGKVAPISEAMLPWVGQRSIIDRKVKSDMLSLIGRNVLNCKAILSHDCGREVADNGPMTKQSAASAFITSFQARVREARAAKGLSQKKIAVLLGEVDQGTYKQWEARPGSLLPHEYVSRFCAICDVDYEWLFTGLGRAPAKPVEPKQPRRVGRARRIERKTA